MWNDLLFTFNTVAPIMLIIGAGYFARRMRIIGDSGVKQMNLSIFYVFLPALIFTSTMSADLSTALDVKTLAYAAASTVASFGLLFLLVPRFCCVREMHGVLVQGIGRANFAIFGLPLVTMIYPGADISIAAVMVAFVIPIFNVLSIIALTACGGKRISGYTVLKNVVINPLIIAAVAGLIMLVSGLSLPGVIAVPLAKLSDAATPLALFILGASIDLQKAKSNVRFLSVAVLARLVLLPLVFIPLAALIGIRDVSLAAIIALFASPTAVSSYSMAQKLGGNAQFAAEQVVFTTAFSCITVFLWVFVFKVLGLLS